MACSAHGTVTTWKLPGRLCGRWVDTAVCGRGAARGGLECTPARRPERRRQGEGTTHTKAGSSLVLGAKPGVGGLSTGPGRPPTLTPQTHTGTQHVRAESVGQRPRGPSCAPVRGRREILTVAEAVVERPGGRAGDDGILGDPRFSRGVSTEGDHVEGKLGDNPQGA